MEIHKLTDYSYDIIQNFYYHYITNLQFYEIQLQKNLTNKLRVATKYGLHLEKSILDLLYHD